MIQYLKDQAIERIQKRFPDLEMKDFYWVITVPALWSDQTVVMYRDLIIEVRRFCKHVVAKVMLVPCSINLTMNGQCWSRGGDNKRCKDYIASRLILMKMKHLGYLP